MNELEVHFVPVNTSGRYDCDIRVMPNGKILLQAGLGYLGMGREDEFLFLLGCNVETELCPANVDEVWILKVYGSKNEYELVDPWRVRMNFEASIKFLNTRKMLKRAS